MTVKLGKVLFVRLSAMGDVINCLPALRLLKKACPSARVTWAVEEPSAGLLRGDPDIDDIFLVRRREWTTGLLNTDNIASFGAAFAGLRRRQFDVAIDFQGNLRSGVVTIGSGARLRVGFSPGRVKEHAHVFYTKHVFLPKSPMHRIEKNLVLLEALGIKPEVLPADLKTAPDDGLAIGIYLKEKRLDGKKLVVVHPGVSRFGAFKQWRPEGFAEIARRLLRRRNTGVIVSWGPGERALADRIVEMTGGKAVRGPQPGGLKDLAYLLERSALFVGCDTGPLHLAVAVGTPAVAIFGPKDPSIYGPVGGRNIVVRREVECSPCNRRACPDPKCMKLITEDEVYEACLELLRKS